jgi:transcriptional regulator with XRE-family HTH domain
MKHGRERLREWLDRSKMSQRKTAELIGVTEQYFGQLLHGDRRMPSLMVAIRIEDVTGVPARSWDCYEETPVSDRPEDEPTAAGKRP